MSLIVPNINRIALDLTNRLSTSRQNIWLRGAESATSRNRPPPLFLSAHFSTNRFTPQKKPVLSPDLSSPGSHVPTILVPLVTTMSSDNAYSSFLDQANQDTSASGPSAKSIKNTATAKAVDTEVPAPLQQVEQYYTSEADEPFEPVSLKWERGSMPSESTSSCLSTCRRGMRSNGRERMC